jgi:mono/diheme cytochrome c family protein
VDILQKIDSSASLRLITISMTLCLWTSPLHGQAVPPAAKDGGAAEQVPAPTAKDGAELFSKSGCPFCHGPQGAGTDKAPNIREVRKRKTDEEIFHQIHDGGKMMPPFADALTANEIHSLVLFLRADDGWQQLPPPQPSK